MSNISSRASSMEVPNPNIDKETRACKYILVTGGVCSSLGKGMTISSIGALLRARGYAIASIKIDPYLNVDAGLMSPYEHGEVYVLQDGGEVDLDLGNYERWLGVRLTRDHNITTGNVMESILHRERRGDYLGKTVQLFPHFTDEVLRRISKATLTPVDEAGEHLPQVCLIELGGTVGDMESGPLIDALRQLTMARRGDVITVHCSYLPIMSGEHKTKPTQHSVSNLMSYGMHTDFLVCRSITQISPSVRFKLAERCNLGSNRVIDAHNVDHNLYELPVRFENNDNLTDKIIRALRLPTPHPISPNNMSGIPPTVEDFARGARILRDPAKRVSIAFVGKYAPSAFNDTYFSVMQTFEHTMIELDVGIDFVWISSEEMEKEDHSEELLAKLYEQDGVFIPGGFGVRGVEGKIRAIRAAREKGIPCLGICLGMQLAMVEFARNVVGIKGAVSEEFLEDVAEKDGQNHSCIVRYMPDVDRARMGANMRLGEHAFTITEPTSQLAGMYSGETLVKERHRHRYEFNMEFYQQLSKAGLIFSASHNGQYNAETRVEAIELPSSPKSPHSHPFFVAVQYHPEFQSTLMNPSPPYMAFVAAVSKQTWP